VFDGVTPSLQGLKSAGFKLFLITNQSGIGRGLLTESDFQAVQREFLNQLGNGLIDGVYFAPEAPDQPSNRRKPAPGMLLEAASEHDLDLAASWVIGDKSSDIKAGRAAGTRTILVLTGYGRQQLASGADFVAQDVNDAIANVILKPAIAS
jgi:histidinol-phosphate phosphatase family protein